MGWLCVAALAGCRPEITREDPPPPETAAPPAVQGSPSAASSEVRPAPRPSDGRFAFDFDDIDLPELVKLISSITGKRFVYSGALPKLHASSRSPEPVTAEEAYQTFLSILSMNGLTVVVRGRLYEIRPSPGVPVGR